MAITTITNAMVSVNAIQGTLIADNAITAVHIATNAVSGTLIADNAVTATHIAQNTITVTQLADDAVEAAKIADSVITTNHLNKAMISSQTEVTAVGGDFVLIGDTSDSNNLKKALVSDFGETSRLPLAGGTLTGNLTMGGMILKPSADGGSIGLNRNPDSGAHVGDSSLRRFQINGPDSTGGDFIQIQSYDSSGTHKGNINIQDGKVGIRDTSPDAVLKVNSTGGGSELVFKLADASDNSVFEVQGGGTAVFQYGKVGIGTTSPDKLLEVSHGAASHNAVLRLTGTHASAYAGGLEWYSGYGPKITAQMFSTASGSNGGEFWINVRSQGGDALTQCFRINNAGMQGFNNSATYNGHGNFVGEVGGGYKALCFERTVGGGEVGSVVTNTSSTTYNTSSDYRLKENIRPIENGLERLNNLNPVKFDWKSDGTSSEGFIAHETQEIFPDAVSGDKDDEMMQGMDYGRITPLLVKAVQEQQTIIDDLKERIKTLEG